MARYYDASVGRFISRDTYLGAKDKPQTMNLYAYANENPVMYKDHNGHFAFLIPIGVVIGGYLIEHLIVAGLALVISGVTYIAVSEFEKRPKSYNHYVAIRERGRLFIGNGLSRAKAVLRLRSGLDTWSTSKSNANLLLRMLVQS